MLLKKDFEGGHRAILIQNERRTSEAERAGSRLLEDVWIEGDDLIRRGSEAYRCPGCEAVSLQLEPIGFGTDAASAGYRGQSPGNRHRGTAARAGSGVRVVPLSDQRAGPTVDPRCGPRSVSSAIC